VAVAPIPVHLSKRDVWSPPISSPTGSTVWCIGSEVKVTWYVPTYDKSPRTDPMLAKPAEVVGGSRSLSPPALNVISHFALPYRDASHPPAEITDPTGTLYLGHLNSNGSGGENLDVGQLDSHRRL
jgi:hypothetical protein